MDKRLIKILLEDEQAEISAQLKKLLHDRRKFKNAIRGAEADNLPKQAQNAIDQAQRVDQEIAVLARRRAELQGRPFRPSSKRSYYSKVLDKYYQLDAAAGETRRSFDQKPRDDIWTDDQRADKRALPAPKE